MEYSMSKESKTLIVVEGGHLEPVFFEQIKKVFGLNIDIYCLKSNIYLLYKKMYETGFNVNIKDVLLEIQNTEENKKILSQNFAYTYLIFDFDPHHTEEYEKDIPLETIVDNNITKVREMAKYFVDETDPTIVKLYINYPMMESFKDCDSFDDEDYLNRMIGLDSVKQYKSIVGNRKMANKRVDTYTKSDFTKLTKQNVKKLEIMCSEQKTLSDYALYLRESSQTNILHYEEESVRLLKQIAVLNTSVFFALDYYGNKSGFFDETMKDE